VDFDKIYHELSFQAVRGGGPGGQNVNKVSTCAQLNWEFLNSTGLTIDEKNLVQENLKNYINKNQIFYLRSEVHRDLERNKNECREKLKKLLVRAFTKEKERKPTTPTKASKRKKQKDKMRRSEIKKLRKIKYE